VAGVEGGIQHGTEILRRQHPTGGCFRCILGDVLCDKSGSSLIRRELLVDDSPWQGDDLFQWRLWLDRWFGRFVVVGDRFQFFSKGVQFGIEIFVTRSLGVVSTNDQWRLVM